MPSKIYSWWVLAGLIVLVIFAGRAVWNIYGRYQDSRAILAQAEKELAIIQEKMTTLEKTNARLKTEQGTEDEIRQKYQVAKDDERLIVIVNDENQKPAVEPVAKRGLWQSIVNFFKRN